MLSFELSLLDFLQAHLRCAFLDAVVPVFTKLGDYGILWILLTAGLLAFPKTRRVGLAAACALLLELLLCNLLLKPLVARERPYTYRELQLLISPLKDYSFPSGHTAASFAVSSALFFRKNRLWIPAFALSILLGFTRLYLYVHFPSDVLCGALLGVFAGFLGCLLAKRLETLWTRRRSR
ncbi:MAG: phosphatase PAP2 family protein [Oscillospiraceae bacterium]|nr:phosphatase PAP2 family protein [Oscillospiraceae bacterium]